MLSSILSLAASLLKLLGWGSAEIHDAEQRREGKIEQSNLDQAATIKDDQNARVMETRDAALGDSDLDAKLQRPASH